MKKQISKEQLWKGLQHRDERVYQPYLRYVWLDFLNNENPIFSLEELLYTKENLKSLECIADLTMTSPEVKEEYQKQIIRLSSGHFMDDEKLHNLPIATIVDEGAFQPEYLLRILERNMATIYSERVVFNIMLDSLLFLKLRKQTDVIEQFLLWIKKVDLRDCLAQVIDKSIHEELLFDFVEAEINSGIIFSYPARIVKNLLAVAHFKDQDIPIRCFELVRKISTNKNANFMQILNEIVRFKNERKQFREVLEDVMLDIISFHSLDCGSEAKRLLRFVAQNFHDARAIKAIVANGDTACIHELGEFLSYLTKLQPYNIEKIANRIEMLEVVSEACGDDYRCEDVLDSAEHMLFKYFNIESFEELKMEKFGEYPQEIQRLIYFILELASKPNSDASGVNNFLRGLALLVNDKKAQTQRIGKLLNASLKKLEGLHEGLFFGYVLNNLLDLNEVAENTSECKFWSVKLLETLLLRDVLDEEQTAQLLKFSKLSDIDVSSLLAWNTQVKQEKLDEEKAKAEAQEKAKLQKEQEIQDFLSFFE